MSASSFFSTQLAAAHRRCCRLLVSSAKRRYNGEASVQCRSAAAAASTDSSNGLNLLIDELTEGDVGSFGRRSRTTTDFDVVKNAKSFDLLTSVSLHFC